MAVVTINGVGDIGTALSTLQTALSFELRNTVVRRSPTEASPATARAAIGQAAVSAGQILNVLGEIRSAIVHAGSQTVVGESDFARATRQNDVNQLLLQIDRIVEASAVGGINLLSGSATATGFQTDAFGGNFVVEPKPLDVASLHLTGLTIVRDQSNAVALGRIDTAIQVATSRANRLVDQFSLFFSGTTLLDRLTGNTSAEAAGARVNFLA